MEDFLRECYPTFSDLISEEDFSKRVNCFDDEEVICFLRATLLYQQAIKCKECAKDVSIALLCSAVEAISGGGNIVFKDWLIKNYLQELSDKNEEQIKKNLNNAYQKYTSSEENREGISYNFRKFLTTYCPDRLKNPPVWSCRGTGVVFDVVVRVIYSEFRCLYLHKGRVYAGAVDDFIDKEKALGGRIGDIWFQQPFKVGNNYVNVEMAKITDWFADVVKNSLFQYLITK